MDGIEKAINGLKHCTTSLGCFECPYSELDERSIECQLELDRDALELLKEQHETIKSLEQEIRDKNVRLTERAEQVERLLKKSVPQGVVDQIRWERDTALSQLKEIGKGLGEKMDDVKPMKPHYTTLKYIVSGKEVSVKHPECPKCIKNSGLYLWDAEIERGQAFCKRCGQSIDWSKDGEPE